jgi:hypothetical protein
MRDVLNAIFSLSFSPAKGTLRILVPPELRTRGQKNFDLDRFDDLRVHRSLQREELGRGKIMRVRTGRIIP